MPVGWTLAAIRDVSGDRRAVPLDADRRVTWVRPPADDQDLRAGIVLGFGGLCLVKAIDDDDWYMGSPNDDGSVICWAAYADLHEALRGL